MYRPYRSVRATWPVRTISLKAYYAPDWSTTRHLTKSTCHVVLFHRVHDSLGLRLCLGSCSNGAATHIQGRRNHPSSRIRLPHRRKVSNRRHKAPNIVLTQFLQFRHQESGTTQSYREGGYSGRRRTRLPEELDLVSGTASTSCLVAHCCLQVDRNANHGSWRNTKLCGLRLRACDTCYPSWSVICGRLCHPEHILLKRNFDLLCECHFRLPECSGLETVALHSTLIVSLGLDWVYAVHHGVSRSKTSKVT